MERAELERLLNGGNEQAITDALLSAAYYDQDWKWVQTVCLQFLDHPQDLVKWYAIICFGHIARVHRNLDTSIVFPRLMSLRGNSALISDVYDVLDEIKFHLRIQ